MKEKMMSAKTNKANTKSPKGKPKIFWTENEREDVARKAYGLIASGSQSNWTSAIFHAQKDVIVPSRYRTESALSGSASKELKELALKLAGATALRPVVIVNEADSLMSAFATQLADRFGKELTEKLTAAATGAIKKVEHDMMRKIKH